MRVNKLMAAVAVLGAMGSAHAVDVLVEGFNSVPGLTAGGWVLTNNSTSAGESWYQGNSGIFPAAAGAVDSYVAASYLSTGSGAVSNWLITPVLTLDRTSTVSFQVRNAGEGFLDTIELRLSTGTGSDVGSTSTSTGTFGTLVGSYAASTASGWVTQTYTLSSLSTTPVTGRLAFRYVVGDVATAGNYIGIDSLRVTAVPEPTTYALFGIGLAGIVLRRRLAAMPV